MSSLTKTKKTQNNTTTTNNPVTRKRCPNGQRRNKQGDCVNSKEPTEENLAKLDTISPTLNAVPLNAVPLNAVPLNAVPVKKKRCPTGQRRNKQGECVDKNEDKAFKNVENVENVKEIRLELSLGDIIQINNEDTMYYINYVDEHQMDCVDISDSLIKRTFRIEDGHFVPNNEIRIITIIYKNPLRGFVKQHHFNIHTWIEIYFKNDPNPLIAEITNIQEDMIQIQRQDKDIFYFINFKYQGVPKTSNIQTIRILPEGPPQKNEQTMKVQNVSTNNKIVVLDTDEIINLNLEDQYPILNSVSLDNKLKQIPTQTKDSLDEDTAAKDMSDKIVFMGEFPTEIEKTSYNRYGINTQVNDILENKLTQLSTTKRTAFEINKIHTLITRYKQLRQKVSVFDLYGTIYDIVQKSPLYKPLLDYLIKYQNTLLWMYPVSTNITKKFTDPQNTDDELEDDYQTEININNYLQNIEILQKQPHQNLQELNLFFTPFENTNQDHLINNTLSSLTVQNNNGSGTDIFCSSVRKFILGQIMITKEKNSKVINYTNIMDNDSIATHSLVTLPISAVNYSRISLPGTSILTKATLGQNMEHWNYLLTFLNKKTQDKNINQINSTINSTINTQLPNTQTQPSKYVYNVNNLFETKALYYKSDEIQNKETNWDQYLESVIPSNKVILKNLSNNKQNAQILNIPYKLSMMDMVQTLEPFMIYPDNVNYTFMYYKNSKLKNNTVQNVVENQIHQYMYLVQKGQKYFNDYQILLQSVSKNINNKHFIAGIRAIEKYSKNLKTDYYVNESLKMVNQNKYLLFSENVKHIMLDMNNKILLKSETVRLNQLKKENPCTIKHFSSVKEMNQNTDGGVKPKPKPKPKDKDKDKDNNPSNAAQVIDSNLLVENLDLLNKNAKDNNPIIANPVDIDQINDEISNFYTLKSANASKCTKCNQNVGMIFTVTNDLKKNTRTFRIQCGNKENKGKASSCSDTVIKTDYMYYTESMMAELRLNIKTIQTNIIILKNNALFGYETADQVHALFVPLKSKLLQYMSQYINILEYIMFNCGDSSNAEIENIRKDLNKYVSLLDKETQSDRIISNYVEHIHPLAEKIRKQSYRINYLDKIVGSFEQTSYHLIQQPCSRNIYEYNINPSPNQMSFVHKPKKLNEITNENTDKKKTNKNKTIKNKTDKNKTDKNKTDKNKTIKKPRILKKNN